MKAALHSRLLRVLRFAPGCPAGRLHPPRHDARLTWHLFQYWRLLRLKYGQCLFAAERDRAHLLENDGMYRAQFKNNLHDVPH